MCACVLCFFFFFKLEHISHHAGVDCSLLYITGDAGHKRIPVFKVGVKISLQTEGERSERGTLKTSANNPGTMVGGGDGARECVPGTWWRREGARCTAAGPGGAAPPAGPHWTGHPPGSRGSSWQQGVTHTTPQADRNRDRECEEEAPLDLIKQKIQFG